MKRISIIIPVYNEESNLQLLVRYLLDIVSCSKYEFEIIFINDGSEDNSVFMLKEYAKIYPQFSFIDLSRNFGQQSALKAGYDHANGDAVICMDADLQNPPELINKMLYFWEDGYDVVLCSRKGGQQFSGFFKEFSSKMFYKILDFLSDIPIDHNAPDFRLLDRKLVEIIKNLPEKDIFFRGLISWMGFRKITLEYEHGKRAYGQTSYTKYKMFKLAVSAITSFSTKPLHIAIYLGLTISVLSLFYILYAIIQYVLGNTISGWSSLIIVVSLLGGLQLFVLGIIGVYLGRLFMSSKNRPDYIVKDKRIVIDDAFKRL